MPSFPPSDEPTLDGDCLSLKNIELVDIFSRKRVSLQPHPSHQYPNETLIHHGYLGCSPLFPTVAISICTLAAYRQAHRTCPRFSIQAQCKALCHLHNIPYRPYLNAQFSDAYDIYLEILHRVDVLINQALNRSSPNWRLLNCCPCCFYKLEDEENLALDWLVTMDGNNSLKRWTSSTADGTARKDSRRFRSDYWLDRSTVDRFKDEVRGQTHPTADIDNWQDVEQTDTAPSFTCVDRWRNAGPEQRKRMFSVFDESGIFIAACRHRFILLACDMVKSGELAKYPLAIVDRLLTVYGKNGGCAYDIGCAFAKTLGNSTLGPRVTTGMSRAISV
ncbi:uncharacterized protein HD556DRAFT_1240156 [Suillus plorans]|uniref:CxC1-like cysteine cluster associated with KDZ transposases domain-containing protein n=1 Tax=Suillus plorans TaxID=116603 RepID=A0A9P7ALE7_9AGAM|nr:uncharacterized protein HD556DRAFT_1240156 [Suillus plorans]KAG1791821.1 hypothetical protein HD556DRAFT_1240156 [Suillus plorans]